MPTTQVRLRPDPTRRNLLKLGGAVIVSLTCEGVLPRWARAQTPAAGKPLDPADIDSFLAFHADGTVTIYTGKVDVGTGLRVAVAQMAAEELGVPAQRITIVDGDTGVCPDQGGTGGSTGLTRGGADVRQAAATARQARLGLGAARLNRPAAELTIAGGEVHPMAGGPGVAIASLVGDRRLSLKVDPKAPLRDPLKYTVVGRPLPRPDVPAKCTGRHVYVHDFTLPGMLHARVIRPSAIGATLLSVDESSIRTIPGIRVVRVQNFLALATREAPLQLSNLRAPGKIANVFAVESFTDELAAAAGADPIAFRLDRLTDPRAVEVIRRTAQAFGWQTRRSPNPRPNRRGLLEGRGMAYMRYKQAENYVALAMDVTVDPATGRITVARVVCAHDCGLIVNTDALKNQVEGCIVQTLSRALHEEVTFDRSRVTSVDWASYPILRFPEAPQVEVILIDRPDQPLLGAGEAATAPVAAALANAIFDATGARLRTVPFTPERVKAALNTDRKVTAAIGHA